MKPTHAAARAIEAADYLIITAGAGMGVDSGLPDFRGDEGFWNAYPPYREIGVQFYEMASPLLFDSDASFAWGFYGHRLSLYRATEPHPGFATLQTWARQKKDHFVVTSNVDGQFQKSGFANGQILEIHGSIHHLQCCEPCSDEIWPATGGSVDVDMQTMHAKEPLPRCIHCGNVSRPNILMFGDHAWIHDRTSIQRSRYETFLANTDGGTVAVVEIGAGTGIPSIRMLGEGLMTRVNVSLIRINPREPGGPKGTISIQAGGLAGIDAIDAALSR
jgi:NAD-dependent SIR2 family protein deacetylase